ncbi:restriction endonuclease [Paucibacter sp. DJ2R-2]|uniref:restriction endonuclease n=1 Tax=Paucibacter sp. DJ2R-2 TaxID=2893558 RepID=UPI0021E4A260|nr:restriction endonuclease [Paucibacter sp. DJ2R-2]MCV2419288.1 restriction endonuclease [Paucibacter sp. DJ4R-1]MCV2437808.1 restriction endonuclease [Paucibacter sp. DJ2R-2]
MAKKRTGVGEDLLSIAAALPWWASLLIGLVSYPVLHKFAAQPASVAVAPGQMATVAISAMVSTAAGIGQYLLPLIFGIGAAISFWKQRRRSDLIDGVAESPSAEALDGLSWREFEVLVGEALRLQGYTVVELGGGGPDGGVDLVLSKGKEQFLVQCKQWKAFKVGVTVVRELYGVMAAKGAAGGFVVTSGRFTADAVAFANGRNVKLVDGERLLVLIKQARQSLAEGHSRAATTSKMAKEPASARSHVCPGCGAPMLVRTAKKGANVGAQFWGCSTYPTCKVTEEL